MNCVQVNILKCKIPHAVDMIVTKLIFKYVEICLVISIYWVVSILTVFLNKTLLSGLQLDCPVFIVWFQCFISVCVCLLMKLSSSFNLMHWEFPSGSPFELCTIKNVFPTSILFSCMILFNTLCLKDTGVAFYYIGRSLTTVFNVALTYLILNDRVSKRTCLCCCCVVIGFFLGIDQENFSGTLSLSGTISGVLGSLSLALYSIYTKKVLTVLGNHILLLSYFNNVYSCILLFPFILMTGEIGVLANYPNLWHSSFWILMIVGGLCGFSIGFVTSLQIKVTSPLTHNISGTAKACVQTVIASFYYGEVKTVLWWFSNVVILGSTAAYSVVRQQEMQLRYSSNKLLTP